MKFKEVIEKNGLKLLKFTFIKVKKIDSHSRKLFLPDS